MSNKCVKIFHGLYFNFYNGRIITSLQNFTHILHNFTHIIDICMCHKLCNASKIYYYADTTVLASDPFFGWVSRQENCPNYTVKKENAPVAS